MSHLSAPGLSAHGDTRSGNTLDCSTGAIILREGADAVGSSHAARERRHAAVPAVPAVPARRVPRAPSVPRSLPEARHLPHAGPAASAGFAIGASVAAIAGMFVDRADLLIAVLAAVLAGALMLALWQAACRDRR